MPWNSLPTRKRSVVLRSQQIPGFLLMLLVVDVFDNSELKVDFKPLYHCIHIYTALDSLDELRKSYQADRRVRRIILQPFFLLTCHRLNRN